MGSCPVIWKRNPYFDIAKLHKNTLLLPSNFVKKIKKTAHIQWNPI